MNMTFRPLTTWPGTPSPYQKSSPFGASYSSTLDLFERELSKLSARNIVLECDVEERQIRLDGQLRGDAQPRTPGVVLSFDSKHGPLRYACDRFYNWKANLRAIALGLEALRKLERYGIASRNEQYTGWKQLGSGIALGPAIFSSREEAARFIARSDGDENWWEDIIADPEMAKACYHGAAKKLHPDSGGDHDRFVRLQAAWEYLTAGGR